MHVCEMEEERSRKGPLNLDWVVVLGKTDDEPPPSLVIINNPSETPPPPPQPQPQPKPRVRDDFAFMSDSKLDEQIERTKRHIKNYGPTLRDKGEKLQAAIRELEDEREERKHRRAAAAPQDADECGKPTQLSGSGDSAAVRQNGDTSCQFNSRSSFATLFGRKMEQNTDCRVGNAFDKELTTLAHCNRQGLRSGGGLLKRRRQNSQSSSRQLPFQSASSLSVNEDRCGPSNGDQKGRASSTHLSSRNAESFSTNLSKKKDACQILPSNGSRPRKGETVVLLDEDETQLMETMERENKLAECMKDSKIFYPSRDDPESVEIAYQDLDCLAPEAFLTSPVMNFYIRYLDLQASTANKATCDYHCFNTFFYKKLEQAISYKGSDKESFFVKFRRWWKGVNIFQKAYILIPIHEDLHWSLVIISFPDKEDDSGPIILHLDSLGFHHSGTVFSNIRSYLKEEWKYMDQEEVPPYFSEKIWRHLPRRINEKRISVPQQENDYDCGPFVLFFMERFIEEAPTRLKKRDLAMFDKRWFRPEEASYLRKKIRNLLMDEFQNAFESGSISERSPSASVEVPP